MVSNEQVKPTPTDWRVCASNVRQFFLLLAYYNDDITMFVGNGKKCSVQHLKYKRSGPIVDKVSLTK